MINHGIIIIKIVNNNIKKFVITQNFYEKIILIFLMKIYLDIIMRIKLYVLPLRGVQWIDCQLSHGVAVGWDMQGFQPFVSNICGMP